MRAGDDMDAENDETESALKKRETLRKWMQANGPNINHNAVKRKLDKRKILRA